VDQRLFSIATKVATPISLASLGVIAIYLIYRSIIGLHIFGDLTGDQTIEVVNNVANKIFYLAIVLSVLSIPSYLYVKRLAVGGQQIEPRSITGNVLSEIGHPVTGAIVFVEGVDRRKHTDENGWFQIRVEDRESFTVRAIFGDRVAFTKVVRRRLREPVRLILSRAKAGENEPGPDPVQANPSPIQEPNEGRSRQAEPYPKSATELAVQSASKPAAEAQRNTLYCSFCGKSQHEVKKPSLAQLSSSAMNARISASIS
jgi:hypothetical protein